MTNPDTDTTAASSWKSDPNYNSKTSCIAEAVATATTPATYWCKSLNVHFYKNWVVDKPSDQDLQLTADKVGKNYDVFGWTASYSDKTYTGSVSKPALSAIKQMKVVF